MLFGFVESESINMPDWTDHPSRDRVVNLVRCAPSATTSGEPNGGFPKKRKGRGEPKGGFSKECQGRRESKGGVFRSRNGKCYTVNIRPSKWNEKNPPCKFWFGRLPCGWALYLADMIFHYTGKPLVHFKDSNLEFPVLECIGTDSNSRVLLTTSEVRFNYIQSIAGEAFVDQRNELIRKVREVMKSPDYIRQGERLLNFRKEAAAALPREEAAISSEGAVRNENDDYQAEGTPPLEEDPMSLQALREIQFSAPLSSGRSERLYLTPVFHVPGSDNDLVYGLGSSQAYAPSFEINPNSSGKKSMQSVGQSFAMDDCPETPKKDKEGYRNWMDRIAELRKFETGCN